MKNKYLYWPLLICLGGVTIFSWIYALPGYMGYFNEMKSVKNKLTPKTYYKEIEKEIDKIEIKIDETEYAQEVQKFYKPISTLNGHKLKVNWIYDGDTIKGKLKNGKYAKVRILGIDCPETSRNSKCMRGFGPNNELSCEEQLPIGRRAKKRAIELLKGKEVTILAGKNEDFEAGNYGRLLAYIDINGRDYGAIVLREGLCWNYGWKYPHPRHERYKKIQRPLSYYTN